VPRGIASVPEVDQVTTLSAKLVRSFGWLAVQRRRTALPRTHQASEGIAGSVLTRHADLQDPNYAGVFYVGLGDRFDDDRRLVREAASELRPAAHPHLGRRFLFSYPIR
jgi:hypothetical protein